MSIVQSIVGRLHVGTPDSEVVEYVLSRFQVGAWERLTPQQQHTVVLTAIEKHHENQALYKSILRGGK